MTHTELNLDDIKMRQGLTRNSAPKQREKKIYDSNPILSYKQWGDSLSLSER